MPGWAKALQAYRDLGPKPLILYALYHIGLRSGHFGRILRAAQSVETYSAQVYQPQPIFELPDTQELAAVLGDTGRASLLAEAEEILDNGVRLFGGQPRPLDLVPAGDLQDWTAYELGNAQIQAPHGDIKFIWEPGRFGWAIVLGRAYHLTQDERFAAAFWENFETFRQYNPPFKGPNWVSAQEVALRLIALAFAGQVFSASVHSTPQRRLKWGQLIAQHAVRIPPTLVYARAQNNNHLLSEAVGLYTASLVLPHHPQSKRWRELGWTWFQKGICMQVTPDGVYMQQSANYHRVMLQLGLWMDTLCRQQGVIFGELTRERLASATRWALALLDPVSGCTPNLGANDGAYILPLNTLPFEDYRPLVQAASAAFLQQPYLPQGGWDEMRLWFGLKARRNLTAGSDPQLQSLAQKLGIIHHPTDPTSWAYLRLAAFHDRPGHADLLHVDLWREGKNLAIDPGTYLYNGEPPWDNALTRTQVHNTVLVDGQEQMRRAGRFLYLDWARTCVLSTELTPSGTLKKLVAEHNGYARLGVIHRRSLCAQEDGGWLVEDQLLQKIAGPVQQDARHTLCLQWLLPDWPWKLENRLDGCDLYLDSSFGKIQLSLTAEPASQPIPLLQVQVIRAGELLAGEGNFSPTWGWNSPRYGDKMPALAVRCTLESQLPLIFISRWIF